MRGLQGGILAGATALALGLAPLGAAIGADGLGDGTASVDCVPSMMESLVPAPTEREEGPSGGVSGELMESSGRTKSTTRATLKAQLKKRKRVAIIASIAIITLLALLLVFVIIKKRGKANKKKKEKKDEENKAGTETLTRPDAASDNYIEDYLKNNLDQTTSSTEGLKEFLGMYRFPVNAAGQAIPGEPSGAWESVGESKRLQVLTENIPTGRDALKNPQQKSLLHQVLYASLPSDRAFTGSSVCKTQATDGGCLWYITNVDPKNSPQDGVWNHNWVETKLVAMRKAIANENRTPEQLQEIQSKADISLWEAKRVAATDETLRPLWGRIIATDSARVDVCRWAGKQPPTSLGKLIDHEDFRCRVYGRGGEVTAAQSDIAIADLKLRLQFQKQLDESHENLGTRALHDAWVGAQVFGKEIEEQVAVGVRLQKDYKAAVDGGKTSNDIMLAATHEFRQWHEIHEYGSVKAMALEAEMRVAMSASDTFRRLAIERITAQAHANAAAKRQSGGRSLFGPKPKPAAVKVSIPPIFNKTSYGLADIDTLAQVQKGAAANMAHECAFQLFKANLLKAKLSYVQSIMADTNKQATETLTERYNVVFKK